MFFDGEGWVVGVVGYASEGVAVIVDGWERARLVGYMAVQPYLKKGMKPHGVLPFPWDAENRPRVRRKAEPVGKEEAKKRFLKVIGNSD